MSDGDDGSEAEGNEGEEELQLDHKALSDSGPPAMRSRSYDAIFFIGVAVVLLAFTFVVLYIKS